jgi:hypothetical protein
VRLSLSGGNIGTKMHDEAICRITANLAVRARFGGMVIAVEPMVDSVALTFACGMNGLRKPPMAVLRRISSTPSQ